MKPQTICLPPETSGVSLLTPVCPVKPRGQQSKFRADSKKDRDWLAGSGHRRKMHSKDSLAILTSTNKSSSSGGQPQGCVAELGVHARESLRWEGTLEDPMAEEKRLELYRANRRQRYITHREALLKETLDTLRHTFLKKDDKKEPLSDQQKTVSSLHLSTDWNEEE